MCSQNKLSTSYVLSPVSQQRERCTVSSEHSVPHMIQTAVGLLCV